jgi:hypothetical protein
MPRNRTRMNESTAHSPSLVTVRPITSGLPLTVDRFNPSSTAVLKAVYPSVYHGVDCLSPEGDTLTLTSIVCQTEYGHLSPEVLHMPVADSVSRILRAMYVGVALPGSRDKYGSCSFGSTFFRGRYQSLFDFVMLHRDHVYVDNAGSTLAISPR